MSISQDHKRFLELVKGSIKAHFKNYISSEKFTVRSEQDFVRVSIPFVDIPRLKYGREENQGSPSKKGSSESGDQEGKTSGEKEKAGEHAGDHALETDVSLDDLADILGEQLSLPRIEPRGSKDLEAQKIKYNTRSLKGPEGLRHIKETYKRALKRSLLQGDYDKDDPVVIPERSDFRYKSFKPTQALRNNAVVIYIMDVSGSMGEEQKEIVRIESFWINTWLKRNYKGIETRFIIHDAQAREVDEETFFRTSESGGTLISSSYKLCRDIIEKDYPLSDWNIYPFHFSDGDNWSGEDTRFCLRILKEYFLKKVNMFGYGQVESKYGSGQFAKDLEREFKGEKKIIISRIDNKDRVVDSIKEFLGQGY